MEINERIFYLLDKQGKKASALADFLGIKPSSITGWKNENSYPSSKYILGISKFLNVSVEYLVSGKENIIALPANQQEIFDLYSQLDHDEQMEFKGELRGYIRAKNKNKLTKTSLNYKNMSVEELQELINEKYNQADMLENLIEKKQEEELLTLEENVDYQKNA